MCQKGPHEERYTSQNFKTAEDLCVRNSPVKRGTHHRNSWGLVCQKQPREERYTSQNFKTVEDLCVRKGPVKRGTHYRILKQLRTCVSETAPWRERHMTELKNSWGLVCQKGPCEERNTLQNLKATEGLCVRNTHMKRGTHFCLSKCSTQLQLSLVTIKVKS